MDELTLNLHRGQAEVFKDETKTRMLCAGRRFGKTRLQVIETVRDVLSFDRPISKLSPETVLVVLPTLVQAKRVVWKPLCHIFAQIPGCVINKTEHTISVPNKPTVIVAGAESADGIRGLRVWRFHGDEVQDFPPNFLNTIVFPAMSDTVGSASLLTFTPKGKTNWTYNFSQAENVRLFCKPTVDNPFIDREEIARYEAILPPRIFRQEYEASFESFAGQFYSEFDPELSTINDYPLVNFDRFYMGLDFGDVNPAVVVVGIASGVLYVVEWEHMGDGVNPVSSPVFFDKVARLCKKWGVYRIFCDPSRPSGIIDLRTYGGRHGLAGMARAVGAENKILPGISDVNALFHQKRLFVIKKAVSDILGYRRKSLRADSEQFEDKVAEGQKDHCLDALRYCIHSLNVRSRGKLVNSFGEYNEIN
jgi:hypothetical protein